MSLDHNERAKQFTILSEPIRLEILELLSERSEPLMTGMIANMISQRPSVVSHHLQTLNDLGFVTRVPSGRYALWTINPRPLVVLHDYLEGLLR